MHEWLFLIGRIIFGLFFVNAGLNHFVNLKGIAGYASFRKISNPFFSAVVSGIFLFLGGLSIILGSYQIIGIILIIIFLLLTLILVHNFWVMHKSQRQAEKANFLKNIALIGALVALLGVKTWPFALGPFLS